MKQEKTILTWVKALFLATEGKSWQEKKKIVGRLAVILDRSKRAWLLEEILKKAERMHKNKNRVSLTLACEQRGLVNMVKKSINKTFGRNKEITVEIKPELIAGFRVKTENMLIKASVKDLLEEFKNYYYNGQYRVF